MRSNSGGSRRQRAQRGFGLIEVLVASALLGVALVVMLGSFSSLLVGARIAERRTVAQHLARNQIEALMVDPAEGVCGSLSQQVVDGVSYSVRVACTSVSAGVIEYTVTATDPTGAGEVLQADKALLGVEDE